MDDKLESKLGKWLRKQIVILSDLGRCTKLVLRRADHQKRGTNIWRKLITEDVSGGDIDSLATDIIEEAEMNAAGMGGVQRYVVYSYFKESGDEPGSQFPFRLMGHDERYDENDGEAPTPQGLVQQTQRHLENVMRVHHATQKASMMILARQNEILSEQNEKLLRDRIEYYDKLEQSRSLEHDRLMAMSEHESSEKRKEVLMEKLLLLGPVVINKIAGKKLLPTETSAEMETLAQLAKSLDNDQFQKILSALRSDQQIALIEILSKVQAAEEAKKNGSAYDKQTKEISS